MTKILLPALIASVAIAPVSASNKKIKCYGISRQGGNACGHRNMFGRWELAGQSKKDCDPFAWQWMNSEEECRNIHVGMKGMIPVKGSPHKPGTMTPDICMPYTPKKS